MSYNEPAVRQAASDRQTSELGGLFAPPLPSHTSDPETSRIAAATAYSAAMTYRRQILRVLEDRGDDGATADEIDRRLDWTHLTAARRLTELEKAGLLVCRGDTRPSNTGSPTRVYRRSAP